nr:M48 family metalloprotease [Paraburkholderia sacchari]
MMPIRAGMACGLALALSACAGLQNIDPNAAVSAGSTLLKAATLSDSDVMTVSVEACQASDAKSQVAAPGSAYAKRLASVMSGFGDMTLNGRKIDYKVYMQKDVNAWAMANGCVRVYSGLMDMMSDDELRGVIGHEMGHVALGHSKKAMQTAWTVSAARTAVGATGISGAAALSQSQLGDLTEKFVNAQFSQSQERAADDYSFDLLKKKGMNERGLVTAFQKLATLDGGRNSMMSSHPSSPSRAEHIQNRINKEG